MIVVDTNILYALADRRDKHHAECTEWFRRNVDVLLVVPTVVAEACYLIDRYLGPAAEAAFLDSVGIGDNYAFQLAGLYRLRSSPLASCRRSVDHQQAEPAPTAHVPGARAGRTTRPVAPLP